MNKIMKKGWVMKQNSKKGFEKNEDACSSEGVSLLLDSTASDTACPYLL